VLGEVLGCERGETRVVLDEERRRARHQPWCP
jgi:hypothetical protein